MPNTMNFIGTDEILSTFFENVGRKQEITIKFNEELSTETVINLVDKIA